MLSTYSNKNQNISELSLTRATASCAAHRRGCGAVLPLVPQSSLPRASTKHASPHTHTAHPLYISVPSHIPVVREGSTGPRCPGILLQQELDLETKKENLKERKRKASKYWDAREKAEQGRGDELWEPTAVAEKSTQHPDTTPPMAPPMAA